MLRWLVPIFTVLTLLGQSVTTYAASGVFGDTECCCPIKAKCKCHDHDGKSDQAPTLKRCAGDATLVAPAVVAAIPAVVAVFESEPCVTIAPTVPLATFLHDVSREPEKPPF